MFQQQVNQVDPEQLEQLLESLVKARVEDNYHQMRQAAQEEIETIRQQAGSNQQASHDHVQAGLQQLQQEKQTVEMREQESNEKARQLFEHIQQQAESRIDKTFRRQ